MRILHVSDLHERGPREREHWRRRRVLGEAWERNLDEISRGGAIDLVCFTGDVADWGTPGEYEAATAFFERLLARLRLGAERLFVIPGNHDIMRPVEEDAWKALRDALARGLDPLALSRWMADLDKAPPLGVEASLRERVLRRQEAYRAWVRGALGRPELDPAGSPHGRLGYRRTLVLGEGTPPVQVIGLDTAWLAGDDADAGRLRLTEDQVMRLATGERGEPLSQRLRGMMGRKAIVLVLSSWKEIDTIYASLQRTSPFYNLLETQWIALLEPRAADEIVGWGASGFGPGDEELLRAWAGRHPFYLQLFGHHLARARHAGEGADAGIERFRDQAERHLRDLWRALGERDREELRACVKGGVAPRRRSLRRRGAVTEEGEPFGRVLLEWVREET
ncbi:hypothetical protein BE11_23900 [Sorangium cellulosum]|nr:hypothetical protein BE11_23900 [Sorangium cellulosum]